MRQRQIVEAPSCFRLAAVAFQRDLDQLAAKFGAGQGGLAGALAEDGRAVEPLGRLARDTPLPAMRGDAATNRAVAGVGPRGGERFLTVFTGEGDHSL